MRAGIMLLALAVVAAGCAESPVVQAEQEDDFGLGLAATDSTGVIRGLVVDDAVVPVEGATVTVLTDPPMQQNTDAEGRFGFQGIAPGLHFLNITTLFHETAQVSVEVEAAVDDPPLVKVQVSRLFSEAPYVEAIQINGWIACAYSLGITAMCVIDYTLFFYPGGLLPQLNGLLGDERRFEVPLAAGWQTVIGEMAWEPGSSATSQSLRLGASHYDRTAAHAFGDEWGPSPIHLRLDLGVPHERHGSEEPTMVPPEGMPRFLWIINPSTSGSGYPFALVVDQEFEFFQHNFFHGKAPEGWSFVAGDQPPF